MFQAYVIHIHKHLKVFGTRMEKTVDTRKEKYTPWNNGYYQARHGSWVGMLGLVEGENYTMHSASGKPTNQEYSGLKGTMVYGHFGETHPDVAKETGKSRYNVEITFVGQENHAVLSEDGKRFTFYGGTHCVDFLDWMSEEEVTRYKDSGDPVDALPNHYKIQPENQGKLLWLCGAPGLGKSTSGHLLSKKAGYVYYEADAFMNHLNPYIPPQVDDPIAWMKQKFFKKVPQDRIDDVADGFPEFLAMAEGKKCDYEKISKFYSAMCVDITKGKKRIGGDWAVAQAVPTRELRDHIRSKMGPTLIFVVLYMSKEDQLARLKVRYGDEADMYVNMLSNTYDFFEPATEDEPNAIHLVIKKDMTPDDVVEKILRMVKNG